MRVLLLIFIFAAIGVFVNRFAHELGLTPFSTEWWITAVILNALFAALIPTKKRSARG